MGVRLPQPVIRECHFEKELDLSVRQGCVVLTPIIERRQGWKELIQDELSSHPMKAQGDWEW